MIRKSICLLGFLVYLFANTVLAQSCDNPESPESVRIYYVNGMNNEEPDIDKSIVALTSLIGRNVNFDFGTSINIKEQGLEQYLQVAEQKLDEPNEYWEWLADLSIAPQWFKNDFRRYVEVNAAASYSNDADLRTMVDEYLQDLRSGKKVVLVAHSQGNFYANNAYQYISQYFPKYKDSVGIVSVGTPANRVNGGGPYVTNSNDLIINLVRAVSVGQVLPANMTAAPSKDFPRYHNFVDTYLFAAGTTIKNYVLYTAGRLKTPTPAPECDVSLTKIRTGTAINITDRTATIRGYLDAGKNVDVWAVWGAQSSTVVCRADNRDGIGPNNAGDTISYNTRNMNPNTLYYFRFCAMGKNKEISDGGLRQFITSRNPTPPPPEIIDCGQPFEANGGPQGLSVTYLLGTRKGTVNVSFEAYTIPDSMTIYKQGTQSVLLRTPGFVSGFNTGQFYADGSFSRVTVQVVANSNIDTRWEIKLSCPIDYLKDQIDGFWQKLEGEENLTEQIRQPDGTEAGVPVH